MKCPVCEDVTLVIASREGIEIDHCPQCRGVWLDRGELDRIIERAGPTLAREPAASYDSREREYRDRERERDVRGHDDDRYSKRRKRRSFLEDIFDFD